MSFFTASYTITTTGTQTFSSIPFEPKGYRLTVANKLGEASDTNARFGTGGSDGTNQWAVATLVNSDGKFTRNYTDHCLAGLTTVSGSANRSISATHTSFNNDGGGSWSITVNFDEADDDFKVFLEVFS